VLRPDEDLAAAFQIINAAPSAAGKPDVEVAFRIVRVLTDREEPIATLTPQHYSETTLPANFDLRAGHPLLAAVTAPLATLGRGAYRLKITVNDRNAGHLVAAHVDFAVAATAAALLAEAPAFAPPFRKEALIDGEVLAFVLGALRPDDPSPALARALDIAATGRFAALVDEPVAETEEGARAALIGLARLALGDDAAAPQFQRAQLLGAPVAATRILSGAARAMQGRDADALAAWQEAVAAGAPRRLVAPFQLDAYLRRGDHRGAAALVASTKEPTATASWVRGAAAAHLAARQFDAAIAALDAHLQRHADDLDARWLMLHALYAQFVDSGGPAPRFVTHARVYVDGKGTHAGLAGEWLKLVQGQGGGAK
jgi:hypothetical protein